MIIGEITQNLNEPKGQALSCKGSLLVWLYSSVFSQTDHRIYGGIEAVVVPSTAWS